MADEAAKGEAGKEEKQRPQIELDHTGVNTAYANFCRVTGTPEEVILDFGLNPQPYSNTPDPVHVDQRLVINYYTAKRMLQVLHMTVQRHEQTFGPIEVDAQKRVVAKQGD
jgi:hypothetical protein